MVKLIRWLRGFVVFELKGKFPERFINICARFGISLFDPIPHGRTITGSMLLCDYKNIRAVARKCGVVLRVKERHGLPFLFAKYRSRSGLLAGAAAFVVIIIVMQSFIWTVEINGLDSVSAVEFAETLKESGVSVGAFKGSLDLQAIQRKVMQEVEDIGWMSINILGTKAQVEVKEKDGKPEILNDNTPCNIKAYTDGIIVSMNIKNGKAVVPVGSAVKKGQLLVSGIVENALQNVNFISSDAQVVAATTKQNTFEAKLRGTYKSGADTALRHRVDFLWLSVPVSFSPVSGEYSSRNITNRLFLNNTSLPCGYTSQYCTMFENKAYTLDEGSRDDVIAAEEALFRLFVLKDCESAEITSSSSSIDGDDYKVDVSYTCTEEIGYKENIIVN